MSKPILVLQYPDSKGARTVALAATRSIEALRVFKKVVLDEARTKALGRHDDDILHLQDVAELERLEKLLDLLIPDESEEEELNNMSERKMEVGSKRGHFLTLAGDTLPEGAEFFVLSNRERTLLTFLDNSRDLARCPRFKKYFPDYALYLQETLPELGIPV